MSLFKFVKEIESLQFQIQFSVVGGIEVLQLAMEQHQTLKALRSEIAKDSEWANEVFRRIIFLLGKVEFETQLSYDESISAYLFCLFKEEPIAAYRASWRILDFGGLWWSVQLAQHVTENVSKLIQSIDTASGMKEQNFYRAGNRAAAHDKDVNVVGRGFDTISIKSTHAFKRLSFPQTRGGDTSVVRDRMFASGEKQIKYVSSSFRTVELRETV